MIALQITQPITPNSPIGLTIGELYAIVSTIVGSMLVCFTFLVRIWLWVKLKIKELDLRMTNAETIILRNEKVFDHNSDKLALSIEGLSDDIGKLVGVIQNMDIRLEKHISFEEGKQNKN